jgi:glycerol kinase
MSEQLILSIDQGTSNTKAIVLNPAGNVIARSIVPVDRQYPKPGWVEQDANELWQSVLTGLARLDKPLLSNVAAIGITNQRESVVLWDRATGEPLGPCVSWQCQRGAPMSETLIAAGFEPVVRSATGLPLDAAFSGPKAMWLLQQEASLAKRAARGELCLGTVDSWLLWNLTGGAVHGTEPSNASRTLLFNIHSVDWDDELIDAFAIPGAALPRVLPSDGRHGETAPIGPLAGGIPIRAMLGDSHAALFGHGCGRPGVAKASYGTGTSVMTLSAALAEAPDDLLLTIAWAQEHVAHALEGNILSTGATVEWAAEFLGLGGGSAEVAHLALGASKAHGAYLVPAFVGLGAPYLDPDVRGLLTGLTLSTGAAHLARAALESIAYQVRDVVEALDERLPKPIEAIWADGGGTENDWLMQFQADILGRPVLRSLAPEVAALGVGYMAGLAAEVWRSPAEIEQLPRPFDRFDPSMGSAERDQLYEGWLAAVAQARSQSRSTVDRRPSTLAGHGSAVGVAR